MYRPGYSSLVRDAILGLMKESPDSIDFLDIGSGTGIWTRVMATTGCRSTGVEPNDDMRSEAVKSSAGIEWRKGSAEKTGMASHSFDLVTMASSFHWTDFEQATREIHRVLRPGGCFAALWNPRYIEANPLLVEIEEYLHQLVPELNRVSSGRSDFCDALPHTLPATGLFENVLQLQAIHVERMDADRYIGIWRSVNDVQMQAGPERFDMFISYLEQRLLNERVIEAPYLTRCWVAQRTNGA